MCDLDFGYLIKFVKDFVHTFRNLKSKINKEYIFLWITACVLHTHLYTDIYIEESKNEQTKPIFIKFFEIFIWEFNFVTTRIWYDFKVREINPFSIR